MAETWALGDFRSSQKKRTHHVLRFDSDPCMSPANHISSSSGTSSHSFKDIAQRVRMASGEVGHRLSIPSTPGAWKPPDEDEVALAYLRFSPAILHQQLEEIVSADGDIEEPICRSYSMALLLVDVSGFTRMSVELGAEATRKHCCAFFDKIITCTMEHGGDVLKFLGDALLVGWPATLPVSLEKRRALAAAAAVGAKEIMTKLNGYSVQQNDPDVVNDVVLTLHGALAIDEVYTYEVGHNDRRQFFIGGDVLGKIGAMEGEAKSGEIIMSPAFAELLPANVGDIQKSGNVMVKLDAEISYDRRATSLISDQLALQYDTIERSSDAHGRLSSVARKCVQVTRAHVPQACRDMVSAGTFSSIGELRWVTTIFLGLDGLIPYLNSGDVDFVQKTFLAILACVEATGGAIRQMVLDDKGCVVIMCWGTPGAAYGQSEDAARACECSSRILETLNTDEFHFDHGPHMGITAGEAYVGCIGSKWRCGYAMVGPSVNLSARLMCKADEWQTFVDNEVSLHVLAAGRGWSFLPRSPVHAKGYTEKIGVSVFRPQSSQGANDIAKGRAKQERFIQRWDRLDRYAQMIGKIASVLALGPAEDADDADDEYELCDFNLRALVWVVNELKYGRSKATRDAIVLLRTSGIFRCTRGSYKGDPSYAFVQEQWHQIVYALFPEDDVDRVHRAYADWIEKEIAEVEDQNDGGDVAKAKLALLHHDLDKKLMFHKDTGSSYAKESWLQTMLTCCTLRR